MSLIPIYSRRKRLAAGTAQDIYDYDQMSERLRVQFLHVCQAVIGKWDEDSYGDPAQNYVYIQIVEILRKELGVFKLTDQTRSSDSPYEEFHDWFLSESDIDSLLDGVELCLRAFDHVVRDSGSRFRDATQAPDDGIAEVNARFLEAGFGYQYENHEIIRVDSLILHKEVVVPALNLTNVPAFATANAEYLKAHEAYRHADYETCLTECAKAFESVLKIIGSERGWGITQNDPAQKLVDAAVKAGFLTSYIAEGFTSLRAMLESGVAPMRNKTAAHGAGTAKRAVPKELASFQLHQTAAVLVFLIQSHKRASV